MAKLEAWDAKGNIYYTEDGVPVDGVIDPKTGLFVAGIEQIEDLEDVVRNPFTGEPYPSLDVTSLLPRIGKSLVKIFQYIWHAIFLIPTQNWLPMFSVFFTFSYKYWHKKLKEGLQKSVPNVLENNPLPKSIKEDLTRMLMSDDVSEVLTGLAMFIPWYSSYTLNFMNVMNKDANRDMMKKFVPTLLDAPMYTNILFRQPDRGAEVNKYLEWLGISADQQSILKETLKPILQITELAGLLWRGHINEEGFTGGLTRLGYNQDEAEKLYKLIWIIPPVNDLVRFAVREAFSPDIIEKYELGANFPQDFAEAAKKVGLSEEWSKRYWYSHWELPSVQMGFEMLHRRVITNEDMDLLLRTKDVMPFWRDKIKAISYRPYSRVDVRRMRKLGVLEVEDVVGAYKDIGYSQEKAEKMAAFTELYNRGAEKHLSKSDYLRAYTDNLVSKGDCLKEIVDLGYSESEAELLIKGATFKKFKKAKALSLGNIKKMYVLGVYSEIDAIEQMAKLAIQSEETYDLIRLWDLEKAVDIKLLPEPKLMQLLIEKIITSEQWIVEMKKLRFTKQSIQWLHILYMGEAPSEAP